MSMNKICPDRTDLGLQKINQLWSKVTVLFIDINCLSIPSTLHIFSWLHSCSPKLHSPLPDMYPTISSIMAPQNPAGFTRSRSRMISALLSYMVTFVFNIMILITFWSYMQWPGHDYILIMRLRNSHRRKNPKRIAAPKTEARMLTEMLLLAKNCLLASDIASEMLSFVSSVVASSATNLPSPSIIPPNKFVIAWLSERRSFKYIVPRVSTNLTSASQDSLI